MKRRFLTLAGGVIASVLYMFLMMLYALPLLGLVLNKGDLTEIIIKGSITFLLLVSFILNLSCLGGYAKNKKAFSKKKVVIVTAVIFNLIFMALYIAGLFIQDFSTQLSAFILPNEVSKTICYTFAPLILLVVEEFYLQDLSLEKLRVDGEKGLEFTGKKEEVKVVEVKQSQTQEKVVETKQSQQPQNKPEVKEVVVEQQKEQIPVGSQVKEVVPPVEKPQIVVETQTEQIQTQPEVQQVSQPKPKVIPKPPVAQKIAPKAETAQTTKEMDELEKLVDMKNKGLISQEQYDEMKKQFFK